MDLVSSVHELSNSIINIYPNPANDVVNIDIEGKLDYLLAIYDLEGKLIESSKNSRQIKVELIPIGTYILKIKDLKSGQKIVEKIVIGR